MSNSGKSSLAKTDFFAKKRSAFNCLKTPFLESPHSRFPKISLACFRCLVGSLNSRAAKRGGFKRGGFPIWTCPSFSALFCPFWDFPDFFRDFPDLLRDSPGIFPISPFPLSQPAPTRNSPERVRDTIWTFPEKSGKHPGLETPRFSFSQDV